MTGAMPLPAPEPPSPAEGAEGAACALAAAEREVAGQIARLRAELAGCCPPEGQPALSVMMILSRIADIEQVMIGQRQDLANAATLRSLDEILGQAPAPAQQRARGRHRGRAGLRAVGGDGYQPPLFGIAGLGAATVATVRHAWQAHTALVAGTAATMATAATAAAVLVPASPLHASPHPSVSSPNASASVYSAVPVPSSPPVIPVRKGHRAAVNGSGWVFAPPPPVAAGDSYPPAQDPSQPQDQPSSEAMGRPQLQVQGSLDLGTAGSASLTISAGDGSGWVSWQASSDTAGVSLSSAQGVLRAGGSVSVTVSVTADLQATAGPATVTVTTGDGQSFPVQVTWTLVPLPVPSPDPSVSLPQILS